MSTASIQWFSVTLLLAVVIVAVASSGTGNRVMISPDGFNWTARTSAADNNWSSVSWASKLGFFVVVATSGDGNRVMTSNIKGNKVITPNLYIQNKVRYYTFNQVWGQQQIGLDVMNMMLMTTESASASNNPTRRTAVPFDLEIYRCVITTDNDSASANKYEFQFFKPSRFTTSSPAQPDEHIYPTIFATRTLTAFPGVRETSQAFTFTPVPYYFNEGMSIKVKVVSGSNDNEFILTLYGYQV
jgi:hypothetical protein